MKMYFMEQGNIDVVISSTKPDGFDKVAYPLRARVYISDFFQWCMIDAYRIEGWNIMIDDGSIAVWNNRPSTFDTRHNKET